MKKYVIIVQSIIIVLLFKTLTISNGWYFGYLDLEGYSTSTTSDFELGDTVFYDLDDFVTNLHKPNDISVYEGPQFMKMRVALQLSHEDHIPVIERKMHHIRDVFVVNLREVSIEDLEGKQALFDLREVLLNELNKVVQPIKIEDILYTEILVQ